ncbi:MAG: cupin domain-containing protein [Bacteroidetes bacterium]|nr:cupin domain-containing protein [Bacteroidota bacterium]MBS1755648.1 cupin domain-containing protein [Bacteroidota bacterium]
METKPHLSVFINNNNMEWEQTDAGVKRKIMCFDEKLMLVKVHFEKGAIGTLHSHPHSQITHINKGVFKVTIGDEEKILSMGDAFYAPPNTMHGAECLEEGILIDTFSPMREDFLK